MFRNHCLIIYNNIFSFSFFYPLRNLVKIFHRPQYKFKKNYTFVATMLSVYETLHRENNAFCDAFFSGNGMFAQKRICGK